MAYALFLPFVRKPTATLAEEEEILFNLIAESSYQRRPAMYRHQLLWLSAQKKADDMAEKNYFAHIAPDGTGPNDIARAVGYALPGHYLKGKNNIESLAIGGGKPEAVAVGWLNSPKGHRLHVYGDDLFFRVQLCVGIGRARAQDGRIISVFHSAPCLENV